MAQPSVAREPSMEEILASIRRIIESNDPATEGASLASMSSAYAEDDVEAVDFSPEMAANDRGAPVEPERRPALEVAAPAPSVPADRSMSLADVAARVRAASARHQEMAMQRPSPRIEEEPVAAPEQLAPAPVGTSQSAAPTPVVKPVMQEPPASVVSLPMPELRPALTEEERNEAVRAAISDEPVSEPAQAAEPALTEDVQAAAGLPAQFGAMAGLLSDAAGAQVAKSFGELADVFDGLERRSVEEMAQDMLRPMLQEWLDDNLPTLVERLVREEIERVARGPRR
jgi:uncharacterized protein